MIDRALIVKKEWLEKMFYDNKDWEMRTTQTKFRGRFGLIESGTGLIVGEATLHGCSDKPIPKTSNFIRHHKVENLDLLDKWKYAWYLKDIKKYNKPIPYKHPKGAVIWVKL